MNKKINNPDSIYTQQVKQLIDVVYPQDSGLGSVYEDARHYFSVTPELVNHVSEMKMQIQNLTDSNKDTGAAEQLRKKYKAAKMRLEDERLARVDRLESVALRLLNLCEGETYEETQTLSAKFLGTIMLLTRGPELNFARLHMRYKPLYKAVLTLRLADKLLSDETIKHPYLSKFKEADSRYKGNRTWREKWQTELAIPLITASLLQDIGLQSTAALNILRGEDNSLDEFRLLEEPDRKQLLKLNYQFTLEYLKHGLGLPAYVGNDKAERDQFVYMHTAINKFLVAIVQDAFVSKTGLGELLKIPQIYVSIVLSTKPDYSRKGLPKGYMLIEQLAKKGVLNAKLAEAFISIVGYFPQGFGITFIPKNEKGMERDQYECAIVTHLNPEHPAEPRCRIATRNLQYISSGQEEVVSRSRNLYFPANHKKLMRIGKERLAEIMKELSSNFHPEDMDQLIPSYWEPSDYFSYKKNQNLWNRN